LRASSNGQAWESSAILRSEALGPSIAVMMRF
jgi:hypothetical protein